MKALQKEIIDLSSPLALLDEMSQVQKNGQNTNTLDRMLVLSKADTSNLGMWKYGKRENDMRQCEKTACSRLKKIGEQPEAEEQSNDDFASIFFKDSRSDNHISFRRSEVLIANV